MLENVLKSKWVSSPGNLFNANSVFQKIKLSWNAFVCMPEWSTGVVARMHTCARRCSETRIPKFRSVNAVNNSYRWPPTLATASSSTSSITKLSSWLKVDLLISLRGLAQAIALTTTTSKTLWQEWWHARCHQTDWYIKDALDSWMYEMGNVFGHRLWRLESTTSSPLQKAKWPNGQSRNVEEWKQWPLETIEETDEERCEKGLIHACMWVFTTDLQRTQFQSPRSGNNLFEGDECVSDTT